MSPLVVSGPLTPAELGALCERVRALDRDPSGGAVICDVGALLRPDAHAIDALARLMLSARRAGHELRLRDPCPALCELIDLCGLAAVLRIEVRRQPEEREQALRVQERVEMGDPPV